MIKYRIMKVSHNNPNDKTLLHKGILGLEKAEKLLVKILSDLPEYELDGLIAIKEQLLDEDDESLDDEIDEAIVRLLSVMMKGES